MIRVAYAWNQSGDPRRASTWLVHTLEENLGDGALDRIGSNPARYDEVLHLRAVALDLLATTYLSAFDYARAADTFDSLASDVRLKPSERFAAAQNALALFAALGSKLRMERLVPIAAGTAPSSSGRIGLEYLLASVDYSAVADVDARKRAVSSLDAFYEKYATVKEAATFVLEAAWRLAELDRANGGSNRLVLLTRALNAWEFLDRYETVPGTSHAAPFVDYGALAAFALVDLELERHVDGYSRACIGLPPAQAGAQVMNLLRGGTPLNGSLERRTAMGSRAAQPLLYARQGVLPEEADACAAFASPLPGRSTLGAEIVRALRAYAIGLTLQSRFVTDPHAPAIDHAAIRIGYLRHRFGDAAVSAFIATVADPLVPGQHLVDSSIFLPRGFATPLASPTPLPAPIDPRL